MIPARRLHEIRTMALWPEQTFSQVMGPTCSAFLMILTSLPSIFQGSDVNQIYYLGMDKEESANAELDDEHVGNALASPRFTKESDAEASPAQTYHSNEEEQLLTEARSEILKHENKANLTGDYIRGLTGQIESQDIGSQAYSRRVCTSETRTGSSSRRG